MTMAMKRMGAMLAILSSGVLVATSCDKDKPATENPDGGVAGDDASAADGGGDEPAADTNEKAGAEHEGMDMSGNEPEGAPPPSD